jgi:uric acid transporter
MCVVMIVVMIESTGMFLALGDMTGKKLDAGDITRGLRADGVGTIIGGLLNAFPYTSFSQNVRLVGVTGIRSRFVAVAGGIILIC